ncbi:MAG: hypothetical protein ACRD3W_10880, partial [Terriglobales bacterium]
GIATVCNLPNCIAVCLAETKVHDKDLQPLYKLKNLLNLNLESCPNISQSAVEKLRKHFPKAKITDPHGRFN